MENFFAQKLLPAVTVDDVDSALLLAKTYLENGLDVMEITFRTDATEAAVKAVSVEYPDFKIGAGTILSEKQVVKAVDAGARFGLSPGLNEDVVKVAQDHNLPFIPGVATPSEIEQAIELGCKVLKFFPAEPMGGIETLKALAGPYSHTGVKFIPMGGINESNMKEYLTLENVIAVGGSWLAPRTLIEDRKFEMISGMIKRHMTL